MGKVIRVIRQELITLSGRKAYLFFAFIVPVLAVLIVAGIRLARGDPADNRQASAMPAPETGLEREGFVDLSGIVKSIPGNLPPGQLVGFTTEELAKQAMRDGEITAYYLIPADYISRGKLFYVYPDTKSYLADGQDWVMSWTLMVNLLGGDEALADQVWSPIWNFQEVRLSTQSGSAESSGEDCTRPGFACQSNDFIRYLPSIMVGLFYAFFMMSASLLFNSIGTEKENRTIEVLMTSIHPRQLLAGKMLALGSAGLLQTAAWIGALYLILRLGGSTLRLPEGFVFPRVILVWSVVFFIGGYWLYASLMAGAGALVPKLKEAGAASFIAAFPLIIAYLIGLYAPLAHSSNRLLPIILSFFPLTAPILMVMRLTDSTVPFWQLLISAGLLFISAYIVLRLVAAMFHAQNLLSGEAFSLKRYFRVLLAGG